MKRVKFLAAMLAGLAVFAAPSVCSADVNDFTVTNFAAEETLTKLDPQGELQIVEHINVDFTDYNHGILRAIPADYKGHSLQLHINRISSDSGAPSQYTTYGSNGNTVLKIGDPNQTVTGQQEYTIDYTLRNVISFYKDHDELYWDVNGDQWDQPFDKVSVSLHLPTGLQTDRTPLCYTGAFSSTDQNCKVATDTSIITASTTQALIPGQTLTYVAGFKTGYFQPSPWYQTLAERLKPILEFSLPVIIIGGGSIVYWYKRGRDAKGTGIIVPQYDPPDGLKPAAVGTIIDFKLDNTDISATIIDLAIRGYLKIIEVKQKKTLAKDRLSYNFQLVNADFAKLDTNEVILMKALFPNPQTGDLVDLSLLKAKLYTTAKSLTSKIDADLTSQGYFRHNPASGSVLIIIIGVIFFAIFYLWHFLGTPLSIGFMVAGIIAFICAFKMNARTAKGVAAKEHILGLKLYLGVAEKDRLEKLQGPDAAYAANRSEPTKTVDLFEKLLPYAMVLGVEKQWGRQFESLYTTPPSWYSGNWTTFNAYYLAGSLSDGMGSAVNSAFSAPSSSGSSGFGGGGGFSGGGGGGGGGGGW